MPLALTIDRTDVEDAVVTCVIDGVKIGEVFSLPVTMTDAEIEVAVQAALAARGYVW